MAASLQKSAESFKRMMEAGKESGSINQFLMDAQEHMSAWWELIRSTGSALNTLFTSGADEGLTLLTMLTGVVDKWNEWMQSVQGQASLDQFFADSISIMQAFTPILTGLRDMFSNLITEESIARFAELSSSIGVVLPVLGQLFSLLGQTGVINAAASLLAMLATAIEPMVPILSVIAGLIESTFGRLLTAIQPVIDILSTTLIGVFEAIAPSLDTFLVAFADGFAMVMEAVGPLIAALGPLLEAILPALFQALTPIIAVVAEVASAIATALVPIIEAVTPLMGSLIPLLVSLFVAFNPVLRVVTVLGPVLAAVAEPLGKLIAGVINFIAPALRFAFVVGEWIVKFLTVGKVIGTVIGWFGKKGSAIGQVAGVVGTKIGEMVTKFRGFGDRVRDIVMAIPNFFRSAMDSALGIVRGITDSMKGLFNNTIGRLPGMPKFAAGGITTGPSIVGEAGPEMVIPLTRSLPQIDPSVRAIAAMLRGQYDYKTASSTTTGPSKIVNANITVESPAANPAVVAEQVVNRLVAIRS
jgi:phage-related protein